MKFKMVVLAILAMTANNVQAGDITSAIDQAKDTYAKSKAQQDMDTEGVWKRFVEGDRTELDALVANARKGDAAARNYVGIALATGTNGLQKNERMALEYFHAASEKSVVAAYNAGVMFYSGRGTGASNKKSIQYFEIAAKAPLFPAAHGWLALLYDMEGEKDKSYAHAMTAATNKDALGLYFAARHNLTKDLAQAERLATDGAEMGDAGCAMMLAWIYRHKARKSEGGDRQLGLKMALSYEIISKSIQRGELASGVSNRYALDDNEEHDARAYAKSWWSSHRVTRFDYRKLLTGLP